MTMAVTYREETMGDQLRPGYRDLLLKGHFPLGPEGNTTFVAQEGANLIGMCSYIRTGNTIEMRDYVTLPSLAPAVGPNVLDVAVEHARAAGATKAFLHCRNDPQFPLRNMQPVFLAQGFSFESRYDAGWVIMQKSLPAVVIGP
jgi:hypothetical protein